MSPLTCGVGDDLFPFCRLTFVLLTVSFTSRFQKFHLLIVVLSVCVMGLYLETGLLSQCIQVHFPLSLLWGSVCLVLCWGLGSFRTWVLCMAIDTDLFSFFYMLISSDDSTICWICFLISILYFLLLCQISGVCRHVDLYQVFNSLSFDPPVWFYANARLFQHCCSIAEF